MDSRPPTHIFMHLHKTGGTTAMSLLNDHYPRTRVFSIQGRRFRRSITRFQALPAARQNQFDLIKGHMFFGIHEGLDRPAVYFAMLREPVQRTLSLYNYVRDLWAKKGKSVRNMLLEDFLKSAEMTVADNGMTRQIAGIDVDRVPYGKCDRAVYEQAVDHLDNHFTAVGLTEHFDESLLLFAQRLGWTKPPLYVRKNMTRRPAVRPEHLDAAAQQVMAPYIAWDQRLYEIVQSELDQEIADQSPEFEKKVAEFRQLNAEYQVRMQNPIRRIKRRLLDATANRNLFSYRRGRGPDT